MKFISKLLPMFRSKIFISILSLAVLIVVTYIIILEVTKSEVEFTLNGETDTLITRESTVGDFLEELGIEVGVHDDLSHQLDEGIESEMKINYKEAQLVKLKIDEKENIHYTTADHVVDFFEEIDVVVSEHDDLSVAPNTPIERGLAIELDKAVEVIINDGLEEAETMWTTEKTVAALLETTGIELDDLDRIKPELDERLARDMSISITRIEEVTDIIEERITFSTVKQNDSSIEKGKEQVVAAGSEGLLEKEYKVTLENGEEVARELINEVVKEESQQRIVAVGTKEPKIVQLASRGASSRPKTASAPKSSSKTMTMEATAYTAECNGCSGVTRTGINLLADRNKKVIAVDPSVIKLGTRVYVEGYGEAIAGDTGGAIKGNKIDIHVPTKEEARKFGRQTVKIKILD